MLRKEIIVDLDNVVYPWAEIMSFVIADNTTIEYTPDQLMKFYQNWTIWDDWQVPKGEFMWWWAKAIENDILYRKGVPYPHAVKSLWAISDAEWHIHLATSRLNIFRQHDKVVQNTAQWLADFGIPYRSLSFIDDKHRLSANAIVDDKPEHLVGHNADLRFLYPAPHNRDVNPDLLKDEGIVELPEEVPWQELVDALGSGIVEE